MGNSRIQFRRGSAAFWISENPVLHPGEPGFEKNTKRWKIGDGVLPWIELPYQDVVMGDPDDPTNLAGHILANEPHPVYDDGPSLEILYQNAKV